MDYQKISEIYDANDQIRARLMALVGGLTAEEASKREPDGWSVAEIVEHLAMVEDGMGRICARLIAAGAEKGVSANGEAKISGEFVSQANASRGFKIEAPERVRPSGSRSIAESIEALDANRARINDLKEQFETIDCSEFKFPHPAFGDLTAHEWLALLGGHEARHMAQIERILAA